LKVINDAVGERWLVTLCFVLSAFHNVLYGIAKDKGTIFAAIAVSSFGAMAFPTISAIKSNNVSSSEQGRIQGALYSLSALASASGPVVLRWVYQYTRDGAFMGPGSMFIAAAMLDALAVLCAYALPVRRGLLLICLSCCRWVRWRSHSTPLLRFFAAAGSQLQLP
jgi:DHA1 family tetracycline resistance protein-like MFS transporter